MSVFTGNGVRPPIVQYIFCSEYILWRQQ